MPIIDPVISGDTPASILLIALTDQNGNAVAGVALPYNFSAGALSFSGTQANYLYTVQVNWSDGSSFEEQLSVGGDQIAVASPPRGPVFEYIPMFSGTGNSSVSLVSVAGLSTQHGSCLSDRGRLYGSVVLAGGVYNLTLYSDRLQTYAVLYGTTATLGSLFSLYAQNESGMSGVAAINSFAANDASILAVPTFAVDQDVMITPSSCQQLPGYDPLYGLGYMHAQAMQQIIAADLPAYLPNLYAGKVGMAGFVPNLPGGAMPDLTKLASIDHLRIAQAALVKRFSALQSEHTAEFREIADNQFKSYLQMLQAISKLSVSQYEAKAVEQSTVSFSVSSFSRG